jgi:ribosomal protein L22
MSKNDMAITLRLSKIEQEKIRKKAIEINKLLVAKGHQPLKDSELIHQILEKAIENAKLNTKGEVVIDTE